MSIWIGLLAVALAALLLTGMLRRYALARSLLDIPNERSSHVVPTPRGGGVAIAVVMLLALLWLFLRGWLDQSLLAVLAGAGALVALVGLIDDLGHVPARWRLLVHFGAAAWALVWLGGLAPLQVFSFALDLGWVGHALGVVWVVWLLNLYNFMDGIDGIAGVEAVTVCAGGALLFALSPAGASAWPVPLLLAAAVTGFLVWNFPRARIFMGDAGSGFVGLMLGIFSVQAAQVAPELFWAWVILLGAFVVDATLTLLRRVRRGERFYAAHRSHAYQYASRRYGGHARVALAFGAINLGWLLPVAWAVAAGLLDGVVGVLIAYGPLVWLALRFKAGARELQET
jgi:Fuc2NAc and GlcNAc transferase